MRKVFVLAVFVLPVMAAALRAGEPDKGLAAPEPPEELSALDFFNGHWACTGRVLPNPLTPEHPTTASAWTRPGVGDMWREFEYAEKKTKDNPAPVTLGGFW